MVFLLDVNVIIALIDEAHVSHDAAQRWFNSAKAEHWATCPIIENGVVRIVSNPRYSNSPGSPVIVADVLSRLRHSRRHHFWPDNISLLDPLHVAVDRLLGHVHVTDSYLLALAASHGGMLATFDKRLSTASAICGKRGLYIIEET